MVSFGNRPETNRVAISRPSGRAFELCVTTFCGNALLYFEKAAGNEVPVCLFFALRRLPCVSCPWHRVFLGIVPFLLGLVFHFLSCWIADLAFFLTSYLFRPVTYQRSIATAGRLFVYSMFPPLCCLHLIVLLVSGVSHLICSPI